MKRAKPLTVIFFKTDSGRQPVRDWIMTLTKEQRVMVGEDIRQVQTEWPIGMPHVRPLGDGLHEVRSSFAAGIARILFYMVDGERMILLYGFVKKTQKTPADDSALARKRKKIHETHSKNSQPA